MVTELWGRVPGALPCMETGSSSISRVFRPVTSGLALPWCQAPLARVL